MPRFMRSAPPAYLAMIFVNTKTVRTYLTARSKSGPRFDIPPRERKRIMNQVKNLDFWAIVADGFGGSRGLTSRASAMSSMMPFTGIVFLWSDGDENGLPGTAITLYQPVTIPIFELEKLGIKFTPRWSKMANFKIPTMRSPLIPGEDQRHRDDWSVQEERNQARL